MKNILLFLFLTLISCSDDEGSGILAEDITGTWLLTETYTSGAGNKAQWTPTETGYTYTFNNDRTFTSTRFSECTTGIYTLTKTQVTLMYDCDGFDTGIENKPGTFIENYVFENGKIILTPTYMNCDEGCGFKFKKVK